MSILSYHHIIKLIEYHIVVVIIIMILEVFDSFVVSFSNRVFNDETYIPVLFSSRFIPEKWLRIQVADPRKVGHGQDVHQLGLQVVYYIY